MDKGIGGPLTSWAFWKQLLGTCVRTAIQTAVIAFFSTTLSYLSKALTDVFVPGANAAQSYQAPYQSSSFAQPQSFNAGSSSTRPVPVQSNAQGPEMFFNRASAKPTSPAESHFGTNSITSKALGMNEMIDLYKKDPSKLTLAQQQVVKKYNEDKEKETNRALTVAQVDRTFPQMQKSAFELDFERQTQEAKKMNDDFTTMIQVSMQNDLFCPPGCISLLNGLDNRIFWDKKQGELPVSFRDASEAYWEVNYGTKFKNDRCGMSMKELNVYLQHNPEPVKISV